MINQTHKKTAAAFFAAMWLGMISAHGAVEFSTFGPGDSFSGSSGNTGYGVGVFGTDGPAGYFSEADEFTASFAGELSGIDVAVHYNVGYSAQFDLVIAVNDPATDLPLVSSEVSVGTLTSTDPHNGSIVSLTTPAPYFLTSGTDYWLLLAPHANNTYVIWNEATDPSLASRAYSRDGGATFLDGDVDASAFRINATSVPEPSTWAMLGAGTLSLGAVVICRRNAQVA